MDWNLQAPLPMGFSRQEYWCGLPCPPPEDLPDPGVKLTPLTSPAFAGGLSLEPPGKSERDLGECLFLGREQNTSALVS